jgi:hypothetical protein
MKKKCCVICCEEKLLSEFYRTKNESYKDGRLNWCKECLAAYQKRKRNAWKAVKPQQEEFLLRFE